MATANPTAAPARLGAVLGLTIAAAIATIALSGVAMWLSYESLHDLATGHHLNGPRAWAWPATIDAFVIVGELLVLRAALLRRIDWFAILLVGSGYVGSIILNVVSVGDAADHTTQVVAAIPPTAALLAFTALMRQIYRALSEPVTGPLTPRRFRRATQPDVMPAPADAPQKPVPAAVVPPRPEAAPPVYSDQRCYVIRSLYGTGYRPSTSSMRAAIVAAGLTVQSDGHIRGTLRRLVEATEPHLALLPEEPVRRLAAVAP